MVFRKCPEHGWLATSEYTVDESGETVCPICLNTDCRDNAALHSYKEKPPNGVLKDAELNPREKFTSHLDHAAKTDKSATKTTEASSSDSSVDSVGPLFE